MEARSSLYRPLPPPTSPVPPPTSNCLSSWNSTTPPPRPSHIRRPPTTLQPKLPISQRCPTLPDATDNSTTFQRQVTDASKCVSSVYKVSSKCLSNVSQVLFNYHGARFPRHPLPCHSRPCPLRVASVSEPQLRLAHLQSCYHLIRQLPPNGRTTM